MVYRHSTRQFLIAAASFATALAFVAFPVNADFVVPPVGPGVCVANCPGSSPGTSSGGSSGSSTSAASAAERAARLQRQRQRQIEANNFRLRSIDRARSKLTYPNVIDNFFRSPSIDEQWRQSEQQKQRQIQSLNRVLAAKRAMINKLLGNRPPNWDGSMRTPGTEPDYPLFSKGSKDSAPVALGGSTPADLKGGKPAPTSEEKAKAEAERSRQAQALAEDIRAAIAETFGPSTSSTDVTVGDMLHALQKYVTNEEMVRGFGKEALKIYSVVSLTGVAMELRGLLVAREGAKREAAKLAGKVGMSKAQSGALAQLAKDLGITFGVAGGYGETALGIATRKFFQGMFRGKIGFRKGPLSSLSDIDLLVKNWAKMSPEIKKKFIAGVRTIFGSKYKVVPKVVPKGKKYPWKIDFDYMKYNPKIKDWGSAGAKIFGPKGQTRGYAPWQKPDFTSTRNLVWESFKQGLIKPTLKPLPLLTPLLAGDSRRRKPVSP